MNYNKPRNIAFLSTYPPRECGIATFTQDLVTQLSASQPAKQIRVIAISNEPLRYDSKVMMELAQNDRSSYLQTAHKLNHSDVDLLVIEHEFGIYGGDSGEYLLDLVGNLQIPFVATLHTILSEPNKMQRYILKTLGKMGEKIITMASNTVEILKNIYDIAPSKIEVISHGVPFLPMKSREMLKEDYELKNRSIISTFGLLSPGKGLEYGIAAIAQVVKNHKDVLYFILGQTHPAVKKESGEKYRNTLEEMVKELRIQDNVRFVNKYLTKEEIIRYLNLSDIYLTPYLCKDQAVSGTLAYAVGNGRVVVSTPYSYAKEMLSQGRGLLAEFRNSESVAGCIEYVLNNPNEKKKMEQKTLEKGKSMTWEHVGMEYRRLFAEVINDYERFSVLEGAFAPADCKAAVAEGKFSAIV